MPSFKQWVIAGIAFASASAHSQTAAPRTGAQPQSASAQSAAGGERLGSRWEDVRKIPDFFTGIWVSRSPMVDDVVKVGYTKQAQEYIAKYKPRSDIPLAGENCKTPGMPVVARSSAHQKWLYEPGMIAIYLEAQSMTRFIHLNRDKPPSTNPTYLGNSIGHFEGDTLVVESVGFVEDIMFQYGATPKKSTDGPIAGESFFSGESFLNRVIWGPHGPNLRMVERMRLVEPDKLEVQLTVYDDTVFTEPYRANTHIYMRRKGVVPQEWVCSLTVDQYDEKTNEVHSLTPEEALEVLRKQRIQ